MTERRGGDGWWQASDDKWYPPEERPEPPRREDPVSPEPERPARADRWTWTTPETDEAGPRGPDRLSTSVTGRARLARGRLTLIYIVCVGVLVIGAFIRVASFSSGGSDESRSDVESGQGREVAQDNSLGESMQQYSQRVLPVLEALGASFTDISTAANSYDFPEVGQACEQMGEENRALDATLPAPDANLNSALQDAVDAFDRAARACQQGVDDHRTSLLAATAAFMGQGIDHVNEALSIIQGDPQTTVVTVAPAGEHSEPECLEIPPEVALGSGVALAAATVAAEDNEGNARWYYASRTGGLWITTNDPRDPSGGTVLPLNDQAREESDYGADVPLSSPEFEGADANDAAAQLAVYCALG